MTTPPRLSRRRSLLMPSASRAGEVVRDIGGRHSRVADDGRPRRSYVRNVIALGEKTGAWLRAIVCGRRLDTIGLDFASVRNYIRPASHHAAPTFHGTGGVRCRQSCDRFSVSRRPRSSFAHLARTIRRLGVSGARRRAHADEDDQPPASSRVVRKSSSGRRPQLPDAIHALGPELEQSLMRPSEFENLVFVVLARDPAAHGDDLSAAFATHMAIVSEYIGHSDGHADRLRWLNGSTTAGAVPGVDRPCVVAPSRGKTGDTRRIGVEKTTTATALFVSEAGDDYQTSPREGVDACPRPRSAEDAEEKRARAILSTASRSCRFTTTLDSRRSGPHAR